MKVQKNRYASWQGRTGNYLENENLFIKKSIFWPMDGYQIKYGVDCSIQISYISKLAFEGYSKKIHARFNLKFDLLLRKESALCERDYFSPFLTLHLPIPGLSRAIPRMMMVNKINN